MRSSTSIVKLALLLCLPAGLSGCNSTGVESLQGGWLGNITCLGETSELRLGLRLEQDRIRGTGQIRTKSSNANFEVTGEQTETERVIECLNPPDCSGDAECAAIMDENRSPGRSRCVNNVCAPCHEVRVQRRVVITLRDDNPQIPDPILDLWRFGENRMEGTISSFCPDQERQQPVVSVVKE